MKNITLGKYVPYNSFVHRLDPRVKIFSMILLLVAIFIKFTANVDILEDGVVKTITVDLVGLNFAIYFLLFIFIYIIMRISHVSLKMLFGQLKAMWFMLIFLLIINILVPRSNENAFYILSNFSIDPYFVVFKDFKIYYSSLFNTIYIVFRLIIMFGLTLVLTSTTKPLEITNALEWMMSPLKVIHFPAHEIAMTISLALRFIPTLLEETERIMKAQASRGVDFEHGKLIEKIRAVISLIVPLFISAFQRSEELANAMEARGYNPGAKRTKYRINKWHLRDTFTLLFVVILLGGIITLSALHIDVLALLVNWITSLF